MEDRVLKDGRRHISCILSSVGPFPTPPWEEDTSGQSEVQRGEGGGIREVKSAAKLDRLVAKSLQRQKNYLRQRVEF